MQKLRKCVAFPPAGLMLGLVCVVRSSDLTVDSDLDWKPGQRRHARAPAVLCQARAHQARKRPKWRRPLEDLPRDAPT